ncbi:penicillin-binding transpeptidase domain-containing protein [Paenibacillus sp. UNC499MF]|uniref:penicillin-binding transpeptidase domain-containing protein n=1 Tax=Paenibacillus sp. UNC499MF TaxID=1502751 RepID=UPI0008A03139|nr:penicillin-binding transpeptidase domain-containing protein [Paenibacillus sp. UNC499MF]SEG45852.1 bla regulator protein blaR1 [Paenibacillus sp. UNC499MF]
MRKFVWVTAGLAVVILAVFTVLSGVKTEPSETGPPAKTVSPAGSKPVDLLRDGRVQTLDLAGEFAGYEGCFLLYGLQDQTYYVYNPPQCEKRLSPASTFKITSSLIGLETGAVDENTVVPWDGHPYRYPEWNKDHTLASALANSVTWFYQKMAVRIGSGHMQDYLHRIGYGNEDIQGGIDTFWLGSSLQISAVEQVDFLAKLYGDRLPFSAKTSGLVKRMLVLEKQGVAVLSGKTGTCNAGACVSEEPRNDVLGWFVGHLEKDGQEYVFALNVEADMKANGSAARKIAVEILRKMKLWN